MAAQPAASLPVALTKAGEAFGSDNYDEAVKYYTECMALDPTEARHQLSRARAQVKIGKHIEALSDIAAVITRLPDLASAHQLKGEALFHLEEYESALDALKAGLAVANPRLKPNIEKWIEATQTCIAGGTVDPATLRAVSAAANAKDKGHVPAPPASKRAVEAPSRVSQPAPTQEEVATSDDDDDCGFVPTHPRPMGSADGSVNRAADAMSRPGPSVKAADLKDVPFTPGVPLEATSKYRWQFFQTANTVTLQVFVKKLNKNASRVKVDTMEDHIKVEILDEEGKEVEYTISEDLYGRVKPTEVSVTVLTTNVEVRMVKQENMQWPSLEKSHVKIASNWSDPQAEGCKKVYPSSSRAAKDWDKIEVDVKEEEKTENLEGDAALQRLFKQIYSGADEDTRRAMNKSFQESGGTVLSTNWKDVGQKEITCTPPEGVKVHKFET